MQVIDFKKTENATFQAWLQETNKKKLYDRRI